jgi:hypothetical protein
MCNVEVINLYYLFTRGRLLLVERKKTLKGKKAVLVLISCYSIGFYSIWLINNAKNEENLLIEGKEGHLLESDYCYHYDQRAAAQRLC